MTKIFRCAVIAATLLSCVGCDQVSKAVAKEVLPRHEILSFAHDLFRLQYAENPGAFLGLGAALPEKARGLLFTAGIAAILSGILGYLLLAPALSRSATISLSLIAGGGLGNLIDRIAHGGDVIDFLNIGLVNLRTGIFNIADVAIMVGTMALVVHSLKKDRPADA